MTPQPDYEGIKARLANMESAIAGGPAYVTQTDVILRDIAALLAANERLRGLLAEATQYLDSYFCGDLGDRIDAALGQG